MRPFVSIALSAFSIVALLYSHGTASAEAGRPEQLTTPAGISVQLVRETGIPLVSMRFALPGGSSADPPGVEGATSLMTSLLTEGAGTHDADSFARALSEHGVRISFATRRDHVHGSFDALSTRLDAATELLRAAIAEPRIDAESVARTKRQRVADLELAENDGRRLTLDRWYSAAFPGSPYARPVDGTLASIGAMGRDIVVARHRALSRHGARVVIVGDLSREAAVALVDRVFAAMPAPPPVPGLLAVKFAPRAAPISIARAMPLATAAFGIELPDRSPSVIAAVRVLSHIIGSGDFDSMLMEEIRVRRGFAYAVSTSLVLDDSAALLLGGMSTKPENMAAALATLRETLETIGRVGIDAVRFEAAKSYLTGTRPLDLDGNARRASTLLRVWREHPKSATALAGDADIDQVSLSDVTRVARQLLVWDRIRVVSIGAAPLPATPR